MTNTTPNASLSATDFLGMVDHSILRPETSAAQTVEEAVRLAKLGVFSICVKSNQVGHVARALAIYDTIPKAVISFPHGSTAINIKIFEGRQAIADGAVEVDVVADYSRLLSDDRDEVNSEVQDLISFASAMKFADPSVVVQVILETGYFSDKKLKAVASLFHDTPEIDFLKTSTGFASVGGATPESIRILKKYSGGKAVKASGGVKSLADAKLFIEAGATRLGCSRTEAVVDEINRSTSVFPEGHSFTKLI